MDRKLTTLTTLIYSVGKERFGLEEERVQKDTPRPNRRQTRIQNLRRELRQLRRRYRDSSPTKGLAYSAQSDIAVTVDLTTEGREHEKKDKGKGKEESSIYS